MKNYEKFIVKLKEEVDGIVCSATDSSIYSLVNESIDNLFPNLPEGHREGLMDMFLASMNLSFDIAYELDEADYNEYYDNIGKGE